jgi:hypoxanthine phosphoribosyltransferase
VEIGEVLIAAEEIDAKLAEMGAAITRDYRDKDLLLIGILKGAFVVMADLSRHIDLPVEYDYMSEASYG